MKALCLLFVLCGNALASSPITINVDGITSSSPSASKPFLKSRVVQHATTGNNREDDSDINDIAISIAHRTRPSVEVPIDSIAHIENGLYKITYTPTVSGHYDASITIIGDSIATDLSRGLIIQPARADAIKSTHTASPLVTEGIEESFAIQAIDRYGNELWSELPSREDEFVVDLEGTPHKCSGREGDGVARRANLVFSGATSTTSSSIDEDDSLGCLYEASYSPKLAGTHHVSIRLWSVGGLLGTYFRNADFTRPVWGNADHVLHSHPAKVPWCQSNVVECDSTRLDANVMFDWGFGPPLEVAPDDDQFPIDSFSVRWVGELRVPSTDEYMFHVTLNGQVKLHVGDDDAMLIDTITNPSQSKTVSSEALELAANTSYPVIMEYIHHNDEALIQLEWSSWSIKEKEPVPSSAFYYTRHLGNYDNQVSSFGPSSPFPVQVLPGAIDLTSSPSVDSGGGGGGLDTCVATTECSFIIQTKDSEGNHRYNDGTDPSFVLSMIGKSGWAGEGRVNDDLTYSSIPLEVMPLDSAPLDWEYLDMVEVVHGSDQLTTSNNLLLSGLERGDAVIFAGQTYTVSSSLDRTFDETSVPLDEAIIGPSMPSVALYKAGLDCDTGRHVVTYTPQVRGEYDLDVRLPPVPEIQRIQTIMSPGDEDSEAALSGTFTLTYRSSDGNMQTTAAISYDADADGLKEALESLSNLSEVEVSPDSYSCIVDADPTSGCSWEITFVGSDSTGDVELLMPNDVDLAVGSIMVTEVRTGIPARSIDGFPRTVRVVPDDIDPAWTTAHGQGLISATAGVEAEFTIQAKDDAGNDLLSSVDDPDSLFAVTVTPEGSTSNDAAIIGTIAAEGDGRYRVSYTPTKSGYHTIEAVVKSTADDGGDEETLVLEHIKKSPFRAFVDPAPTNASRSVASDSPGVIHHEGLSTGVYDSQTYFSVQLRDEFDNKVPEGPQSEIQVIEMWSLSPLSGTFDISFGASNNDASGSTTDSNSNKVTLPAGAGIGEVERAIQALPGVGDVSVMTNAAKDTVSAADGRTVAVTTGLATLAPSERLDDEFDVGDWIRIGSRDDGPVFSIAAMSTAAPFAVTLSSAYMGESDPAATIFGQSLHGPPFGFQYIVTFDPTLGDLDALEVDGSNLEGGDEITIHVTSCDRNVYQTIETQATDAHAGDSSRISGTFYLSYKGQRTPDLPASIDAESLESIIEETYSSMDGGIRQVDVLSEMDLERGAKRWDLRIDAYEGKDDDGDAPILLFAEGHLLSSGSIGVTAVCPVASSGDSALEAPSQAGRRGQEFNVALVGGEGGSEIIVHGQTNYVADGLYAASYRSPRVGEYELHVETALSGGLRGQYYNNRWLFGSSVEERIDEAIDFAWTDAHPITETAGNDFISVRWTGYIKPAYNEVYAFRLRVDDGARLWIGDELLIDDFDSTVEEGELYREFQGSTASPLETSRLTDIKIEYQQNRGDASIRLEWSSKTQPWSVVESARLYHEGQPVDESPYIIHTQPIAPTEPKNCSASVTGAKSIRVDWMEPGDDGGEDVKSYRIVLEETETSSIVLDETLLVQDLVDMSVYEEASSVYSLDVGDKATIMESLSLSLIAGKQYGAQVSAGNSQDDLGPFCGQVLVTPMSEPMAVKTVLLDRHPASPTSLLVSFDPVLEERANGSEVSHYRIEWSTDASFATTSSTVKDVTLLSSQDGGRISYEIQELDPGQEYHVRITAINAVGSGPPSSVPAVLAPGSEPEPIEQNHFVLRVIETKEADDAFVSVGQSSTSLLASWPTHPLHDDNGFAIESYVLEYFVADDAATSSEDVEATRITTIEVNAGSNNYTLTDLSPGQPISARIYAKNVLGLSGATVAIPDELAPPTQPPSEPTNVQLKRSEGGDGGSLSISWDPPVSDGGDAITKYLVEYSTKEDFSPSSADFGAYTKVDCEDDQRHCQHTILGLTEGMSYFVRVFAGNSLGFSKAALSHPTSLAPMSPPDRLTAVKIDADNSSSKHAVSVSWRRGEEETTGTLVGATTAYRVEWVETNLYQDYTTQRIQTNGSFRLSFQGHRTKLLAAGCSAYKLKQALESLPTIGSADVVKEEASTTNSWLATFPNFRHMEKLEIEQESTAGAAVIGPASVELVVEAYQGYEVQSVTCEKCLGADQGQSFRLSYRGNATLPIPFSIAPSALEAALEGIGLEVECSRRTDRNIDGFEWQITFKSLLGDLPLLDPLVDPHSSIRMYVREVAKGELPAMTGNSYQSLTIKEAEESDGWISARVELKKGTRRPLYFQVSASNEVGFGPPMYSMPPTLSMQAV